jgi:AraC-like DNA-binding protein
MLTGEWLNIVTTMMTLSRMHRDGQPSGTVSSVEPQAHDIALVTRLEALASASPSTAVPAASGGNGSDFIVGLLLSALTNPSLTLPVFLAVADSVRRMLAAPASERLTDQCATVCGAIKRASQLHGAYRHPKVNEALAQLEAHPQRWAEQDLARLIGVSPSHFGRVIHHDTGLCFRDLRRAATLKPAIKEILLTDEHVAQIGLRVGFQHASQFAREVHETFGLSPRQLRRLWKHLAAPDSR